MSKISTALCMLMVSVTGFGLLDAYLFGATTGSDLVRYLGA
jgi:hypothetical protein